MRTSLLVSSVAASLLAASAGAQCTILVRETFRPGERPHGGNGRLRQANIHDNLMDYWPQTPAGSRWIASDGSGPTWTFAGSSLDPAEIDALDPYNGTAFGEPGAVALIPFAAGTDSFTVSAEAVMGQMTTSATYLGLTSSAVTSNNFAANGALWMSLNGRGEWAIYANGSTVVVSGQTDLFGTFDSGWLHMEFSYNPAAGTVSGRVMNTVIPPMPVTLTKTISHVGMEAHDSWNVVNNLTVRSGSDPIVTTQGPQNACIGGSITFTATANAGAPSALFWLNEYGWPLADGPREDGSIVSGATTTQLTISNLAATDPGTYSCQVATACGLSGFAPVFFTVGNCNPCPADFNQDGGIDGSDVAAFFAAWESGDVAADTNADGGIDGGDIETFFAAWEAGGC